MVGQTTHRAPDAFAERINYFVPKMMFAADVHDDGIYKLPLGSPNVADANGIIAAVTVTGGVTILKAAFNGVEAVAIEWVSTARFGQAVQTVFSAAGTPVINVKGFDYLGQRIQENFTGDGTTPVLGAKAFKRIDSIVVASGVTGTINLGTLDVLGLPYKTVSISEEIADGAVQSAGTFVAPVLTDPQTATTGDPRGTYNPTVTLDGTVDVEVLARADNWRNAAENGGYHGIKHFWP